MRKISNARSSRRAPTLKDSDYDHEINLVDHVAEAATAQPLPPEPSGPSARTDNALTPSQTTGTPKDQSLSTYTTAASAFSDPQPGPSQSRDRPSPPASVSRGRAGSLSVSGSPRDKNTPETAIDVLYENQRGGFLCGIPLFSPKALGQLDPPAWTNVAHKPSPTDIYTAQVPDPSWVWVWDEWHINKDVGVDEDGWEYSFMFAKTFSWHSSKWYNSFVRRRAWIRKRMRRIPDSSDPHMLNTEYFTVRPSTDTGRTGSKPSSRHSRASMSISSWALEKTDIEDMDTLMAILSRARIDREKIEAVENFLEHGEEELVHLQHRMHDIMAIFVFQASRRVLLSNLNDLFNAAQEELKCNDTGRLQRRSNNLRAAIRHADEEVQTLEYWSDVRKLVKEGDTDAAADKSQGLGPK
ncbi:hypothetical protein M406DRAFT_267991 [Cryphonectria parasitica EP155]|uniref:Meiotically up-regulated 65 protein n=1 Tax=Cryphonectria parasitica (strain ATCC 38755 / EP155) TaxID=660469 RepID=A0A9P5CJN5_CRYP1|nr:uncharacterized protein M406DRAFT_267991 [Cryphonectria parasitica EP155]KAF3761178.1 hypothetical protein M406DRAFT_267991 [Cryphonectria parasitica EP155]